MPRPVNGTSTEKVRQAPFEGALFFSRMVCRPAARGVGDSLARVLGNPTLLMLAAQGHCRQHQNLTLPGMRREQWSEQEIGFFWQCRSKRIAVIDKLTAPSPNWGRM